MSAWGRRVNLLANIVIVLGGGFLVFGPDGPVGKWVSSLLEGRRLKSVLEAAWPQLSAGPVLGYPDAEVAIIEFSDYQCPFCRQEYLRMKERDAAIPGVARVFDHFPLAMHPAADGAARTAICSEEQGRFPEVHAVLMTARDWQVDTNWSRVATSAGIPDLEGFEQCLTSDLARRRLDADIALGRSLGVKGTPTYFSRRKIHYGVMDDSGFRDLLETK